MEHRLKINEITPETRNWTCKVQVVDHIKPKLTKQKGIRIQTIFVEDEEENQVCLVLFGANIQNFEEQEMFKLFNTYLISTARVQKLSQFSIPGNAFEWIVDEYTIVEKVDEEILPPPRRLNTIALADIDHRAQGVEFDIVAVVVNSSTIKYLSEDKRRQDVIITDQKRRPFFFTIWGELADDQGTQLFDKIHNERQYPVIVAKRISINEFKESRRFVTRYNSNILIDPPYPQVEALHNWIMEKKEELTDYTAKSSSESPTELILATFEDEILPISEISSQFTDRTCYVEGKISLADELDYFYILMCADCKHMVRHKEQKRIFCMGCHQQKMLIPRCLFEVDITDSTGTVKAIMLDTLGETMLAMTATEIYRITAVEKQLLPVQHITQQFTNKIYRLYLQRPQIRIPDKFADTWIIQSCTLRNPITDKSESSRGPTSKEGAKKRLTDKPEVTGPATPAKRHQS